MNKNQEQVLQLRMESEPDISTSFQATPQYASIDDQQYSSMSLCMPVTPGNSDYTEMRKPSERYTDETIYMNTSDMANTNCVYSVAQNRPEDRVVMVDNDIYSRASGESNNQTVVLPTVYSTADSRPEDSVQMVDNELHYSVDTTEGK